MASFDFSDVISQTGGDPLGTDENDTVQLGFPSIGTANTFRGSLSFDTAGGFDTLVVDGVVDLTFDSVANLEATRITGGEFSAGMLSVQAADLQSFGDITMGPDVFPLSGVGIRRANTLILDGYDGLSLQPEITALTPQVVQVQLKPDAFFEFSEFGSITRAPVYTGVLMLDLTDISGPAGTTVRVEAPSQFLDGFNNATLSEFLDPDSRTLQMHVTGGALDDDIVGNDGNDELSGKDGADRLIGGFGNDTLIGGEGADNLQGDTGNNLLIGGPGNDILFLGLDFASRFAPTSNTVVFAPGDGSDRVLQAEFMTFLDLSAFGETEVRAAFDGQTRNANVITLSFSGGEELELEFGSVFSADQFSEARIIAPGFNIPASSVTLENVVAPTLQEGSLTIPTKVADIVADDPDSTQFSLSGSSADFFEIVGTELFLLGGLQPPSGAGQIELTVLADGVAETSVVFDLSGPNGSAENISVTLLRNGVLDDGSESGALARLSFIDNDGNTEISLSGADSDLVALVDNEIVLKDGTTLDAKSDGTLDISVSVDGEDIAISVPVVDADGGSVIPFGGTPIFTLSEYVELSNPPVPAVILYEDEGTLGATVLRGGSFQITSGFSINGFGATGVFANGSNTIANNTTINIDGAFSAGVFIAGPGEVHNAGTINGRGLETVGLGIAGNAVVSNEGEITISGREGAGLFFDGSGTAINLAGGVIQVDGEEVAGIFGDGSGILVNEGRIIVSGDAPGGTGISGDGDFSARNSGEIDVLSTASVGVGLGGDGSTVLNEGAITTSGSFGVGLAALGSNLEVANTGTIVGSGPGSVGMIASGFDEQALSIAIGSGASVLQAGGVRQTGPESFGIVAVADATEIEVNGNVEVTGPDSYAIASFGDGIRVDINEAIEARGLGTTIFKFGDEGAPGDLGDSGGPVLRDLGGLQAIDVVLTLDAGVNPSAQDFSAESVLYDAFGGGHSVVNRGQTIAGLENGFVVKDAITAPFNFSNDSGGVMSFSGQVFQIESTSGEVGIGNQSNAEITALSLGEISGMSRFTLVNEGDLTTARLEDAPDDLATGLVVRTDEVDAVFEIENSGDVGVLDGAAFDLSAQGDGSSITFENTGAIAADILAPDQVRETGAIAGIRAKADGENGVLNIKNTGTIAGSDFGLQLSAGTGSKITISNAANSSISATRETAADILPEDEDRELRGTVRETTGIAVDSDGEVIIDNLGHIDGTNHAIDIRADKVTLNNLVGGELESAGFPFADADGIKDNSDALAFPRATSDFLPSVVTIRGEGARVSNSGQIEAATEDAEDRSKNAVLLLGADAQLLNNVVGTISGNIGFAETGVGGTFSLLVNAGKIEGSITQGLQLQQILGISDSDDPSTETFELRNLKDAEISSDSALIQSIGGRLNILNGGLMETSFDQRAISMAGVDMRLFNEAGGVIKAEKGQGIAVGDLSALEKLTLLNAGQITSFGTALAAQIVLNDASAPELLMANGGTITVTGNDAAAIDLLFGPGLNGAQLKAPTRDLDTIAALPIPGQTGVVQNTGSVNLSGTNAVGMKVLGTNAALISNEGDIKGSGNGQKGVSVFGGGLGSSTDFSGSNYILNAGDIELSGLGVIGMEIGDVGLTNVRVGQGELVYRIGDNLFRVESLEIVEEATGGGPPVFPRGRVEVSGENAIGVVTQGANVRLGLASANPVPGSEDIGIISATGEGAVGVALGGSESLFVNNGYVFGTAKAVQGDAAGQSVFNLAFIDGLVDLAQGDDVFRQSFGAEVSGNIQGGTGTDRFELFSAVKFDSFVNPTTVSAFDLGKVRGFESIELIGGGGFSATGSYSGPEVLVTDGILFLDSAAEIGAANFRIAEKGALELEGVVEGNLTVENGGALLGTGTVTGDVFAAPFATIAPGFSPGQLTIKGDLILEGTLELEVGGPDPQLNDALIVEGQMDVSNGSVQITFVDGYVPELGQSFNLIQSSQLIGLGSAQIEIVGGGSQTSFILTDDGTVVADGEVEFGAVDDGGVGFVTDEDTTFTTANVLDNDINALLVTAIDTTGTIGLVTSNGDGTVDYDPNGAFESLGGGESATDSFSYTVTDGNGASDTAVVIVGIAGINDAPLVGALSEVASEDEAAVSLDLLSLGSDPENDALSLSDISVMSSDGRMVSFTSDGDGITIEPGQFGDLNSGESVDLSVTFSVSDGDQASGGIAMLRILGADDAVARNDISGTEGSDCLMGTEVDEFFFSFGGRLDRMDGGGGTDTFVFGAELSNGVRERDLVTGFGIDDVILLASEAFELRDINGGVLITHNEDQDRIYVLGEGLDIENVQIEIGTVDLFA